MGKRPMYGVLLGAVVFGACSCMPEGAVEGILSVAAAAPSFVAVTPVDGTRLRFDFSKAVKSVSFALDPAVPAASAEASGTSLVVTLAAPLSEGSRYVASLLVEDADGNTLSVVTPFRGRNLHPPLLLLNEVRTEYSKPKAEFIELCSLGAGNLGALRLAACGDAFPQVLFEFPPCEVKAGEYIVVHLRSLEVGMVDETGSVSESPGTEACATARDFWVPGSAKLIRKADAIVLLDQDGAAVDAVLLSDGSSVWKTDAMKAASGKMTALGCWIGVDGKSAELGPEDAVSAQQGTASRTVCRDETVSDSGRAADWYICDTSCATPGLKNSPERYSISKSVKRKAR